MQKNTETQISDQKILTENKEIPITRNILEMMDQETLKGTSQTEKHSQQINSKKIVDQNTKPVQIQKSEVKQRKKSSSEPTQENLSQLGGTLVVNLSQKCDEKMGKKKSGKQTKNRTSKQKKSKKEEPAPTKKISKDTTEKNEAIMKPKKTANSIKKNKEPVITKVEPAPRTSSMGNIMAMISQMPQKRKEPVKISQIKCMAPQSEASKLEAKEWHIPPSKEVSQNVTDNEDKNINDDQIKKVAGQCWEIAPSNLIQKQGFQNMAPLLQNDPKSEQAQIAQSDKAGQKKDSPQKDPVTSVPPLSEKVTQWKTNRAAYITELRDLLEDSNSKFYNQFHTNIVKNDEYTKFVKGAKFPDEILQNKKVQTESEQKLIIAEIKRFADLNSPKDQSQFQIDDQTRVPIFKIFAHLVESSKLQLNHLATLCENYLIAQLKEILSTDPTCQGLGIKVKSMITKSEFKVTNLITLLAERKFIDLKNFSAKMINEHDNKTEDQIAEEQKQQEGMLLNQDAIYQLPFWDISGEASIYLSSERLRILQSEKPLRRRVIDRARFLDRIIGMIDKLKKDNQIPNIDAEVERYQKLLDSHKIAIQKEQERLLEKEKKEKLEADRLKMKEDERLFKESERKKREEERLEQKRIKDEQLEKEKKDRFEKNLVLEQERKLKHEQLEQEKKQKHEKLEKEKQEKLERLEKEKKDRLEKIEKDKKERLERIEREKKERTERIEKEKLEKERIQKEEAEKKAKQEAELREKQSLFKYLNKKQEKEHSKSGSQQQDELKNPEKTSINSGSQPQVNEKIEQKFKDYGEFPCIAIKIQKECFHIKDKLKLQSFEHVSQDTVNTNNPSELAEFEKHNRSNIAKYFKTINDNLDKYLLHPQKYNISYVKDTEQKQAPNNSASVIINSIPVSKFGPVSKILRKKSIIIDEQLKTSYAIAKEFRRSKILSCRNPFRRDDEIMNYDMESEDEEAEENGENVEMEERSKDSEGDQADAQSAQAGWLVDDDYLSMSEMNMSNISEKDQQQIQNELANRKAILRKNRESKEEQKKQIEKSHGHLKPQVFIYCQDNYEMMAEFACINFVSDCKTGKANKDFPIDLCKTKITKSFGDGDNDDLKKGYDPNAINLKLPQLIRMVHGSLESKPKIIDDFNEQHPECSRNSIEKCIKENFLKEKKVDEPRMRYFVTEEILLQLQSEFPQGLGNLELAEIAQKRIKPILDELKQQQQDLEEKRLKAHQEKERERQELTLMRQEEQYQRDLVKQTERLAEKKQRDEAKAQELQIQEEEKQRQRDIKTKQRQEEKEKKLKQLEEEKQQKAEERRLKKEEKDKDKIKNEKKTVAQTKTPSPSENVISMLQKRQSTNIIGQINEFEKQQGLQDSQSPNKKQKLEEAQNSSSKKQSISKQAECQKELEKPKNGIMNFFQKLPSGQTATPMKLDFSIAPRDTKVKETIVIKNKTKPQRLTEDQKENLNSININSGKKLILANVEKKENVKAQKRGKSEEQKKLDPKPNRSSSKQKNDPKHPKSKDSPAAKKKVKENQKVDITKKQDPAKRPEKKFKSVQKSLKDSKHIQKPIVKRKSQPKTKKTTAVPGQKVEDKVNTN